MLFSYATMSKFHKNWTVSWIYAFQGRVGWDPLHPPEPDTVRVGGCGDATRLRGSQESCNMRWNGRRTFIHIWDWVIFPPLGKGTLTYDIRITQPRTYFSDRAFNILSSCHHVISTWNTASSTWRNTATSPATRRELRKVRHVHPLRERSPSLSYIYQLAMSFHL